MAKDKEKSREYAKKYYAENRQEMREQRGIEEVSKERYLNLSYCIRANVVKIILLLLTFITGGIKNFVYRMRLGMGMRGNG